MLQKLNIKSLTDVLSLCKVYYEAPREASTTIIFERWALELHKERGIILVEKQMNLFITLAARNST